MTTQGREGIPGKNGQEGLPGVDGVRNALLCLGLTLEQQNFADPIVFHIGIGSLLKLKHGTQSRRETVVRTIATARRRQGRARRVRRGGPPGQGRPDRRARQSGHEGDEGVSGEVRAGRRGRAAGEKGNCNGLGSSTNEEIQKKLHFHPSKILLPITQLSPRVASRLPAALRNSSLPCDKVSESPT